MENLPGLRFALPQQPNAKEKVARRFADRLANLRAQLGETQKQLATRLGMTESMVSRLESGAHLPSITTLCRIADGFNRQLDIAFHKHEHEHEHEHADGIRHKHGHAHCDSEHMHDHEVS